MKSTSTLGSALLVALVLSGCGGGGGNSGRTVTGSGGTGATTSTTVASQPRPNVKSSTTSSNAAYATEVQELYVSYFGRPADPTGLANFEAALVAANAPTSLQALNAAYSTNAAVKSLIDSFGTSTESTNLYGSGSTTQFVTAIYENVLGRAPAQVGLSFWVNAINSGSLTEGDAALSIMAGALANTSTQGVSDTQLINTRLTVAGDFTTSITTAAGVTSYSGSAAAASARSMLATVTGSTNTSSFASTIQSTLASLASAAASSSTKGQLNLSITDGPSDNFGHVWVTISSIALHTSASEIWSSTDATWQTVTLPAPVTIDLAALNNGALNNLFAGMALPVGTYRQIRLFFVDPNATLTASAQATTDNESTPQALQWNDQVEYTNLLGVVSEGELEMAYPTQGVQLVGTFAVTTSSALNLAVDFDLNRIIVPFNNDGITEFTMRGDLTYYDLNQSGAITGQIDTSKLCQTVIPTANCAYNLFVHAELMSSDGSHHYAARSTSINPTTGQFTLYPVATSDANGNPLTYDVVIRGRNMDTVLVTGITPTANTTPTSGNVPVQTAAIIPTITASEYSGQFSSPLQPLTSGWSTYQQTLPGGVPYEIRFDCTDPFSGYLLFPIKLEIAPIQVAAYNSGNALSYTSITPVEGLGGYNVANNEMAYYNLSSNTLITPPSTGSVSTIVPPSPTLMSGVQNGSVSGSITVTGASDYNRATLVIVRFANIVTNVDVSSALTSGSTFTVSSLPSGSATTTVPGAYYYAYLRLWKAGAGKPARIVPVPGFIDLRTTNSVTGWAINVAG